MNDASPYLEARDHKYNTYLIKQRTPTETWGIASKWCDLVDAEWIRKAWHQELKWDGAKDTLAYEAFVSKMLVESRVKYTHK